MTCETFPDKPMQNEDDTTKCKLGATTSQKPPSKGKDSVAPRQVKPSTAADTAATSKPPLVLARLRRRPRTRPQPATSKPLPTAAKGKERDVAPQYSRSERGKPQARAAASETIEARPVRSLGIAAALQQQSTINPDDILSPSDRCMWWRSSGRGTVDSGREQAR